MAPQTREENRVTLLVTCCMCSRDLGLYKGEAFWLNDVSAMAAIRFFITCIECHEKEKVKKE